MPFGSVLGYRVVVFWLDWLCVGYRARSVGFGSVAVFDR